MNTVEAQIKEYERQKRLIAQRKYYQEHKAECKARVVRCRNANYEAYKTYQREYQRRRRAAERERRNSAS